MRFQANIIGAGVAAAGLILLFSCGLPSQSKTKANDLVPGEKYEVVGELYALWVATDLNTRKPGVIAIVPLRLRGPEILSVYELPRGSTIKILRKAQPRWPAVLYPDRYLVESNAIDVATDLPVVLDLAQGNEGTTTALNPSIYRSLR